MDNLFYNVVCRAGHSIRHYILQNLLGNPQEENQPWAGSLCTIEKLLEYRDPRSKDQYLDHCFGLGKCVGLSVNNPHYPIYCNKWGRHLYYVKVDVPIAREVNQHTLEYPIICAIVCDNATYNQNLFFVSIHFCANFRTTNGKKFQKLRLLSNLSDHTQHFKEKNGNTILLQVYNAAHKTHLQFAKTYEMFMGMLHQM